MQIRFIGQGYNNQENNSVAKVLIESLEDNRFHTFKCLSAFASYAGVNGLKQHIINSKTHILNFKIIVGIDQGATSKEALESLLEWEVNCFVYYTSQRIIFHPKIYLFEGDDYVRIIVGSNNLTQTGLAQNIEGALDYTFNKSTVDSNNNVLNQITAYYSQLLSESDDAPNLKGLTPELITLLANSGLIPSELTRRASYHKISGNQNGDIDNDMATIRELFPPIPLQSLHDRFRANRIARAQIIQEPVQNQAGNQFNPDQENWIGNINNRVLVAEIGAGVRWRQVNFPIAMFQNFFGATAGDNRYHINLRHVNNDGTLDAIEDRQAVTVASQNYRFELGAAVGNYPVLNRPIGIFVRVAPQNFLYHIVMPNANDYASLNTFLESNFTGPSRELNRIYTTLDELRQSFPSSPF